VTTPETITLPIKSVERLHEKAQKIRRSYALYGDAANIRVIDAVVMADDFHHLVKRHLQEAGRL
jgi:hypothetical protein